MAAPRLRCPLALLPRSKPVTSYSQPSSSNLDSLQEVDPNSANLRNTSRLKSFNEIPKHKSWLPSAFGLLVSGGPAYLHEHCDKRHRQLGPIFREHLGPIELVFVADAKMMQTVISNEGTHPLPNIPEAWLYYNRLKSIDRGLFFQNGEAWHKLRKTFNKILLTSENIVQFGEPLLQINSDLMKSWYTRHNKAAEFELDDLKLDLCKWSFESTCYMLFGERLNSINSGKSIKDCPADSQRADRLVESIAQMFSETSNFQVLPARLAHKLNLKTWQRFEQASDTMLEIAAAYAREHTARIKQQPPDSITSNPSLLKNLLAMNTLGEDEVSRSIVDLIIASADTTANVLQWMFYLIGKHEHVQRRLLTESKQILTAEPRNFHQLASSAPYLKSFVKETLRLYPTAPFLARTLNHEVALGDYQIPPGVPIVLSLYTTSRMDEYFERPLEFLPDRWLRNQGDQCAGRRNAFASLPFGVGRRKCIGFKLADFEMCLLVASFVNAYESSLACADDDVKVKLRMTLSPNQPIRLRLKARR